MKRVGEWLSFTGGGKRAVRVTIWPRFSGLPECARRLNSLDLGVNSKLVAGGLVVQRAAPLPRETRNLHDTYDGGTG